MRGEDGRITRVRYVLPRHKAANWVGPGRGRKSTRPGASGVVELSPFEFLDRRSHIKIGLTFGEQKFGPKRMVRRLKGGVVIYGDAEFPEAARPTAATDATDNTITGSQAASPFAKALLAAVDPNARKEARKSLDRRQAVGTTSTAPSGTPGGKTAGGLTKEKSFGRANSSGRT